MAESKALALINDLLAIHPKGYDLSLGRIRGLLEKLGNPQDHLPPVIHVAGTNGKGSTIAFCRAMLEADGRMVHVDTSPHLVRYHERFRMGANGGGRFVDDDIFAGALARVAKANDGAAITVFEILTASMFLLFSEHPADVALIEVGLGGRFDSTNVINLPQVSVIAPVSIDHETMLGDRVEKIAWEKAGIIRRNVQLVIAEQDDVPRRVLEARANELGAPVASGGQDFSAYRERGRLVYQDEYGLLDLPLPGLLGEHQITNAATAIATLRYGGFDVSTAAIEKGLGNVSWPGRLQQLKIGKLFSHIPEGSELWVDGGHNLNAGEAIALFMNKHNQRNPKDLVLVSAMLTTKDPSGYFEAFKGLAKSVYTVPVASSSAGYSADNLAEFARKAGLAVQAEATLVAALDKIKADNTGKPLRILVCGTLYLAGEALEKNETLPE